MEIKAVKFRKDGFYTQPFVFGGEEGMEKFDKNVRYRGTLQNYLIDTGDEVILVFKPEEAAPGSEAEQAQKEPEKRSVNPADETDLPTVGRIPALIELIRGIR